MALVDNFESYSAGDLNGQGSWTGDTALDVQTSVVNSGSKAVSLVAGVDYKFCKATFTAEGDGNQVFYIRKSIASAGNLMVRFFESTNLKFYVQFDDVGDITLIGSSTIAILVSNASANTWYKIEVQWQTSDNTVRGRVNDGTWSSYGAAMSAFTSIDGLDIGGGNAYQTASYYFDDFSEGIVEKSVSDIGGGIDAISRDKQFTISEIGTGIDLIARDKQFIITDIGTGIDNVTRGLEIIITDYGIGFETAERQIATQISISEYGVGWETIEAELTAQERKLRKVVHISVYDADGNYIKTWNDADFTGFRKKINGGLEECIIKLARKFDDYGEYYDVKLNNEVRIKITDEDTIGTADKEKLIYSGYISKYEPFIEGGKEGVTISCLGYYTKFAQDIYKNGTTTTITESATDVGTMFRNLMDRYRAETSNPKLNYTNESIETTGTTATYTFEMMTYREAIDIIKKLAPANWWWYVGADHLVKFKPKPTATTHTFIFGRHFTSVRVEKGMEKIKNAVLFWNQITGTGQIYKLYKDEASVNDYGRRITKYIDPGRVGSTTDADKIAEGIIEEHKEPDIKVIVEIIDNNYSSKGYDIESIEPGDTCVFLGFSDALNETFKENMIITEVEYHLNRAILIIEPLSASIVDRIEEIARGLENSQSKDAPTSYTA